MFVCLFVCLLVNSFILKISNFGNSLHKVPSKQHWNQWFLLLDGLVKPPGGVWFTSLSKMKHSLTQSLLINVCLVVVHQQSTSASFMQFFEPFVFLQSSLLGLYYLTLFSERCLIVYTIQFQQPTNHEWQCELPWISKLSNFGSFHLHYK